MSRPSSIRGRGPRGLLQEGSQDRVDAGDLVCVALSSCAAPTVHKSGERRQFLGAPKLVSTVAKPSQRIRHEL